jgi:hypothetical protein
VLVRDRHRDGEIVDEFDSEESGRCGGAGRGMSISGQTQKLGMSAAQGLSKRSGGIK